MIITFHIEIQHVREMISVYDILTTAPRNGYFFQSIKRRALFRQTALIFVKRSNYRLEHIRTLRIINFSLQV